MRFAFSFIPTLTVIVAGCGAPNANAPRNADHQQPEIAIRRGGSWSTLSYAPPHIVGPTFQLELSKGVLSGFVSGAPMDVHIGQDEASGYGPSGPVQIAVEQREGDIQVEGMWNGGPVHFTFDPESLSGLVVWRRGRTMASEQACAYQLTTAQPGTLIGTSSCGGMSMGTRLEVDPRLAKMMTPTEMTVVLVAALASPP